MSSPVRVALVGCGKAKLGRAAPARELYTGSLFRAHLREAESSCGQVYVVSAQHGLLTLDAQVEPYDATLREMHPEERAAWGQQVLASLARLHSAGSVELHVFAGSVYVEPLRLALAETPHGGWTLVEPLKGHSQGARLRVLAEAQRVRAAAHAAPVQELRVAALRVEQSSGRHLYLFAVDGKRVPEFATISRVRREDGTLTGYQRSEALAHIQAIRHYVESAGAMVPNAVVLAFDSRVTFEPLASGSSHGHLRIPLVAGQSAPGFVVDGQQRLAAIREADVQAFPLACSAFISDEVAVHREQFILVNRTKPLPAGLIHELLPGTRGALPAALESKRLPATLVERLNLDEGSPLKGLVVTVTNPLRTGKTPAAWRGLTGLIKDTSLLRAFERSLGDGSLGDCGDDVERMLQLVVPWWGAVRATWPEAWGKHPSESRLFHGAGVAVVSALMDEAVHVLRRDGLPLTEANFRRELARIAGDCAWTEGTWSFPRGARSWKEIQNTPNDIRTLCDFVLLLYRERAKERPATKKSRRAAA